MPSIHSYQQQMRREIGQAQERNKRKGLDPELYPSDIADLFDTLAGWLDEIHDRQETDGAE